MCDPASIAAMEVWAEGKYPPHTIAMIKEIMKGEGLTFKERNKVKKSNYKNC